MHSVFSVDVEDWFHILETDKISNDAETWEKYPSRVEDVFEDLLSLLEKNNVKATFFFLGWIAEKFPSLVIKASDRGHEIAIHGYYHELIYNQTYNEFYEETLKTKTLLESLTGNPVIGYRAPGFSLTKDTVWAYKVLIELGFKYSSSVYPANRAHGSYSNFGFKPRAILYDDKFIVEFPMTVLKYPFTPLSCFGGGYFRLFPIAWYLFATKFLHDNTKLLLFYIHPRDMDNLQPIIDLPLLRKFKSYININSTKKKLDIILKKRNYILFKHAYEKINRKEIGRSILQLNCDFRKAQLHELPN